MLNCKDVLIHFFGPYFLLTHLEKKTEKSIKRKKNGNEERRGKLGE
jgi:hypothetical protein